MTDPPSRRHAHVADTRRALLESARRLFGTRGFAATPLDEVVAAAGVTKGALYHHFGGKRELFAAVYDELEGELTTRGVSAAAAGDDALQALRLGFAAFLDAALDRDMQRIALLDAPAVLGADKVEIDRRHSLGAVRAAVQRGIEEGLLDPLDAGSVARLLISACSEAALLIATADDPVAARRDVGATLDRLLVGLSPLDAQPPTRT